MAARVRDSGGVEIEVLTPDGLEIWLDAWSGRVSRKMVAWLVITGLAAAGLSSWAVKAWASNQKAEIVAVATQAAILRADLTRIDATGTQYGITANRQVAEQLGRLSAQMDLVLRTLDRIERRNRP